MAKSSRSSSRKTNAQKRAANINGPVEQARAERLSAKLMELVSQPKPESSDVNMDALNEIVEDVDAKKAEKAEDAEDNAMDVDGKKSLKTTSRKQNHRVGKNKRKGKSNIVFKKYQKPGSKKKGSK